MARFGTRLVIERARKETSGFQKNYKTLGEEMKKTLTTITLAIVLMFGATFANAGIIVGDSPTANTGKGTEKSGIIIFKDGIIIFAATAIAQTGIIIF